MQKAKALLVASVLAVLSLNGIPLHAQWVMVARAVSGRVQRMNNHSPSGAGYDVATVVLEANADKVYQSALQHLTSRSDLSITSKNAKAHTIDFAKGAQVASLQATPLGEKLTQLVIASTSNGEQPSSTSLVVQGVLRVCKEMNVVCNETGQ